MARRRHDRRPSSKMSALEREIRRRSTRNRDLLAIVTDWSTIRVHLQRKTMPPERFLARQDKLLSRLREAEVDAMLVTGVSNVSYLTGFSGDSGTCSSGRASAC